MATSTAMAEGQADGALHATPRKAVPARVAMATGPTYSAMNAMLTG